MDEQSTAAARLVDALARRFGGEPPAARDVPGGAETLLGMAERGSCRDFEARSVATACLEVLAAVALASPTKSDLQQRDIVILEDPGQRRAVTSLVGDPWLVAAPAFLVFCGNNRRQRQLHDWRGRPFANDHLDAFFNAAVDAAIALATFVAAAESVGLGCCPISVIRDHAPRVSEILALPQHVFPVAGLAVGWPARPPRLSLRLPLAATVHRDRFDETGIRDRVEAYDRRRAAVQPYARQREPRRFGEAAAYGWSEDKARQYATAQRADWGAFIRGKGFDLT